MTRTAAMIIVLASSALAQQLSLRIKGHQLGETGADFLKSESSVQANLDDCHNKPLRAITPDEVKQMRTANKRYYEEMARQGRLFNQDENAYKERCGSVIDAFDKHGSAYVDVHYPTSESAVATWAFDGGRLVGLSMRIFGNYVAISADLTKRIGVKPEESEVPYHNGFGARWVNFSSEWLTSDVHVALLEDNNPTSQGVFLSASTRAKYEEVLEKYKAKGSPLD